VAIGWVSPRRCYENRYRRSRTLDFTRRKKMIETCKPKVLIEINATNLIPYPYSPHDILDWINNIEYSLQNLLGVPVNQDNILNLLLDSDSFKMIPLDKSK
jgi:hypothetical protein